jgi:hypothetical protein
MAAKHIAVEVAEGGRSPTKRARVATKDERELDQWDFELMQADPSFGLKGENVCALLVLTSRSEVSPAALLNTTQLILCIVKNSVIVFCGDGV